MRGSLWRMNRTLIKSLRAAKKKELMRARLAAISACNDARTGDQVVSRLAVERAEGYLEALTDLQRKVKR